MKNLLDTLHNEMIVSCQSEGDDPFNTPDNVALFAKAAEMGGAKAIRTEGLEKIRAIKSKVNLPVIGLLKTEFEDGFVRITGSEQEVKDLLEVGCDIVAIDGTFRVRENKTGPEFIKAIKNKYNCTILADIATLEEAIACEKAGADCVSTTLNGYTAETQNIEVSNFDLLKKLSKLLNIPVFAEGRINTPEEAKHAMNCGAFSIITGTAITRPRVVTGWFVSAIKEFDKF